MVGFLLVNITAVERGAESSVEHAVEPVDEISWCLTWC